MAKIKKIIYLPELQSGIWTLGGPLPGMPGMELH